MIRLASLFWLALVAATGFATFKVKYAVQDIEEELNRVRKQTVIEHQEIHLLRAEWTTLNQPERLADLNRRFLSLAALAPKQLRAVPAPPDALIAAAPAVPAATAVSEPAVPQLAASEAPPPRSGKPLAALAAALMPVKPAAAAQLAVSGAQSSLPENPVAATPAALKSAPPKPAAAQLVKTGTPRPAQSIDRLFAAIAEGR
jgi:hypothetical protein